MSRPRTRPTRDETRDRLLRAAARCFSAHGIGSASIEDICDEAGFSRGAFYSNFSAKDELVIALLDANMVDSYAEMDRLFAESTDATDFIDNLESDRRRSAGPLDDLENGSLLEAELVLYAMRNADNHDAVAGYQRRKRDALVLVLERVEAAVGRTYPLPIEDVAALVMAVDVGVGINKFADPASNPPNQFTEFMSLIHRLWMAAPADALVDESSASSAG